MLSAHMPHMRMTQKNSGFMNKLNTHAHESTLCHYSHRALTVVKDPSFEMVRGKLEAIPQKKLVPSLLLSILGLPYFFTRRGTPNIQTRRDRAFHA